MALSSQPETRPVQDEAALVKGPVAFYDKKSSFFDDISCEVKLVLLIS